MHEYLPLLNFSACVYFSFYNCDSTNLSCSYEICLFSQGPIVRRALCLVIFLKLLIIVIFEVASHKWGLMEQWCRGDMLNIYIHLSLMPCSQIVFVMPLKHRIPVHPQCMEVQQNSRQERHVTSTSEGSQALAAQRGYPFYSNQNLHQREKHNGI